MKKLSKIVIYGILSCLWHSSKFHRCISATKPQSIKLRIGNPTNKGLLLAIVSPLEPNVIKNTQYVPPKDTTYFSGSLDVPMLVTDALALRMTNIGASVQEKLGPQPIKSLVDAERSKVPLYLKAGSMTWLKIAKFDPGLNKAYVTLSLENLMPILIANPKIQGINLSPEIVFEVTKKPIFTPQEQEEFSKIKVCPRFGTCNTSK